MTVSLKPTEEQARKGVSVTLIMLLVAAWILPTPAAAQRILSQPAVQQPRAVVETEADQLHRELAQVDAEIARLRATPGSGSQEDGELSNLQLQNSMERRSKLMERLSNVMKKSSDTSNNTIQNLK